MGEKDRVNLAGFDVIRTTYNELTKELNHRILTQKKTALFFANSNFVVKCFKLREKIRSESNVIIVNDGVALSIGALIRRGFLFIENHCGTDFIPHLIQNSESKLKIFLYGGCKQSIEGSKLFLENSLGHFVVGYVDGFSSISNQELVSAINQSEAQILLVAKGNPLQEEWIINNFKQLKVPLSTGVGALFDIWSRRVPRAPAWIRKLRMEWFFRLITEPKRLFSRYSLEMLKFFYLIFWHQPSVLAFWNVPEHLNALLRIMQHLLLLTLALIGAILLR